MVNTISKMNYKGLFEKINDIHYKTDKNRLFLLIDIVYCGLKYQAGYNDYVDFKFYNLKSDKRKTYLTRGKSNRLVATYNDKEDRQYFWNKALFYERYKDLFNRQFLEIDSSKEEEFNDFIKDKKEVIIKPFNGTHGDGVVKYQTKDLRYQDVYGKHLIMEELIIQDDHMAKLNSSSINTVRVMTFYDNGNVHILGTFLRIGNGKVVDNFCGGGLVTRINKNSGICEVDAVDQNGKVYIYHPISKISIVGFKVSKFDEVIKLAIQAAKLSPKTRYVGWDIAIGKERLYLVEGNEYPSHNLCNMPHQCKDDIGILPEFNKYIK